MHDTVDSFNGAANKNIGDAFLLVWKLPENMISLGPSDELIVHDKEVVGSLSDQAFLAFIKIILEINKNEKIAHYNNHKGLN